MNQYIVVLHEDENLRNILNFRCTGNDVNYCYTNPNNDEMNFIKLKCRKKYVCIIQLASENITGKNAKWLEWNHSLNLEQIHKIQVPATLGAEALFQLADQLPYPGSSLLTIYWYVSQCKVTWIKDTAPLLGALKKLKVWHLADINIIAKKSDLNVARKTLDCTANYLQGSVRFVDKFSDISPEWDNLLFWKGTVNFPSLKSSSSAYFGAGFKLLKCSSKIEIQSNVPVDDASDIWFGNEMKVLNMVSISSIPLLWMSNARFNLVCEHDNKVGNCIRHSLMQQPSAALLCKLDVICTNDEFLPCEELHSKKWKELFLRTPDKMNRVSFKLSKPSHHFYFLVTSVPNDAVDSDKNFKHSIKFDVHGLTWPSVLRDNTMIFEERCSSFYSDKKDDSLTIVSPPKCSFPLLISTDKRLVECFFFMLKNWKEHKSKSISTASLRYLLFECFQHFKVNESNSLQKTNHKTVSFPTSSFPVFTTKSQMSRETAFPEWFALQTTGKNTLQTHCKQTTDTASCSTAVKNVNTSANAQDLLTYFSSYGSAKVLDSLYLINKENLREKSHISTPAMTPLPHALPFKVDPWGDEEQDKLYCKMVKTHLRFETLSLWSKHPALVKLDSQPSRTSAEFPMRTLRKREKLKAIAEKRFNTKIGTGESSKYLNKYVMKLRPTKNKPSVMSLKGTQSSTNVRKVASQEATVNKHLKRKKNKSHVQDNKKRLHQIVRRTLCDSGVKSTHPKFNECTKRLYDVSMAFLKDLKSSKSLETKMSQIVQENTKLVLSYEGI